MMNMILGIIASYLIGSIPTAYIFGKVFKGIDIREHGSGNVGATNVFRVLGKNPGIVVLSLDITKGIVPVVLISNIFGLTEILPKIFIALAAVCGHNWTVFLKFKGGKGMATSLGVLIGLMIQIAAIRFVVLLSVLIWVGCFLVTSYVSLSSIIAGVALPILMVMTEQEFELICLGIIFCIFIVIRHRPNIKRLFAGQEPRVPLPFRKSKSL